MAPMLHPSANEYVLQRISIMTKHLMTLSVRISADLLSRLDALIAVAAAAWPIPPSRSHVLRIVVQRGIQTLERELKKKRKGPDRAT